jgi:nucleotide-binding universal stress UspA family protein
MKILLGVDDSPCSMAAIEYVKRATWPREVQVIVMSAATPVFVGPGEAAAPMVVEQLNDGQVQYHRGVAERAAKELQTAGFKTESRSPASDPRTAILDTAKSEKVDLIVVGSHGRSGLAKLLLGSVASHVVTHAHCSVLVVKLP